VVNRRSSSHGLVARRLTIAVSSDLANLQLPKQIATSTIPKSRKNDHVVDIR
jgi:hypothetical protein